MINEWDKTSDLIDPTDQRFSHIELDQSDRSFHSFPLFCKVVGVREKNVAFMKKDG